jgi:gliding motility-associated-like protein
MGQGRGYNVSYLWTPNLSIDNGQLPTPKISPADDTTYKLTVTSSDGCKATDEVFVKVLRELKIPNAFSPNKDGMNDTWEIQYLESYPGCTVEVYNRFGQIVFRSAGYNSSRPWDGTLNGKPLPVGTYYWIINLKNGRNQMNGSVTIMR